MDVGSLAVDAIARVNRARSMAENGAQKNRLPVWNDDLLSNLVHICAYMYDYARNREQGAPYYFPVSSFLAGKNLRQKGTLGALSASVVRLTSSS